MSFSPQKLRLLGGRRVRVLLRGLGFAVQRRREPSDSSRALRLPVALGAKVARHPTHLAQHVFPVRTFFRALSFAVRPGGNLRARQRFALGDAPRAVDQSLLLVVPLATLLVRLVDDAALIANRRRQIRERRDDDGDGFSRRGNARHRRVQDGGRCRVQHPLLVVVGLGGGRRGGFLRAFRLGGFRRRALVILRARHRDVRSGGRSERLSFDSIHATTTKDDTVFFVALYRFTRGGLRRRATAREIDSLRFDGEVRDPRASVSHRFALARSIGREPRVRREKKKKKPVTRSVPTSPARPRWV